MAEEHLDVVGRAKSGDDAAFCALIEPLIEPGRRLAQGMLHTLTQPRTRCRKPASGHGASFTPSAGGLPAPLVVRDRRQPMPINHPDALVIGADAG